MSSLSTPSAEKEMPRKYFRTETPTEELLKSMGRVLNARFNSHFMRVMFFRAVRSILLRRLMEGAL